MENLKGQFKKEDFRLDFIGIGAAKAGTTWLCDNLALHPEIFIPKKKELVYFNPTLIRLPGTENLDHKKPIAFLHDYFEASEKRVNGEFSVQYIQVEGTAQKIFDYNPKAKIIAILRHPAEQVFSYWQYNIQRGVVSYKTLEAAIKGRPDLFHNTFYYRQLKPYFDLFPAENIGVFLFDDMIADRKAFFKSVTDFIGVAPYYPESLDEKSNVTQKPKSVLLNRVIQGTRHFITKNGLEGIIPILKGLGIVQLGAFVRDKANVTKVKNKPKLENDLKNDLIDYYLSDIEHLEKLIGRDLSKWKQKG